MKTSMISWFMSALWKFDEPSLSGVAAGSSCQMALLVTPFSVLVGWAPLDKRESRSFFFHKENAGTLRMRAPSCFTYQGAL